MESLEVSARTVEEAIVQALRQMGADRSEVEIAILAQGRAGVFGVGAQEARVRVTLLAPAVAAAVEDDEEEEYDEEEYDDEELPVSSESAVVAREIVEKLLDAMQLDADVVSVDPPLHGVPSDAEAICFDIQGDELGVLIGRRGSTLASMQYIVNLIGNRLLPPRTFVVLDVEGYRRRRYESLEGLALRMAELVRTTGQGVALEPMPPAERRIVHMTLQNDPDVATTSIGEGEARKVTIIPRRRA